MNYTIYNDMFDSTSYSYDPTDTTCTLPSGVTPMSPSEDYTYVAVQPGSTSDLETALVEKPVIVSLKAGNNVFRNYESGVI